MKPDRQPDVLIIGAGLSGLACALHLERAGLRPLVLEAGDGVGGRVRSDRVEGFTLDRGFQVLLTAYPECREMLDYDALDLRPFEPGAMVRTGSRFVRISDPRGRPTKLIGGLLAPVGSIRDKLRMLRLVRAARRGGLEELFDRPETATHERLQNLGFGERMRRRFLDPFLRGIFLESRLATSSRMLEFVLRMFAEGPAALPARGMAAIPRQLAASIPEDSIRLNSRVTRVGPGLVVLDTGKQLTAPDVVVAAEGPALARLLPEELPIGSRSVTCLYFDAPRAPVRGPWLILDGNGEGPVNNLCFPSEVAPELAPRERTLVSASVIGMSDEPDRLRGEVVDQLRGWFGDEVDEWRHLRTYEIRHALPNQDRIARREVRVRPGLYVAGDHRESGSLQGAMVAGRRAAEAVRADRAVEAPR